MSSSFDYNNVFTGIHPCEKVHNALLLCVSNSVAGLKLYGGSIMGTLALARERGYNY